MDMQEKVYNLDEVSVFCFFFLTLMFRGHDFHSSLVRDKRPTTQGKHNINDEAHFRYINSIINPRDR